MSVLGVTRAEHQRLAGTIPVRSAGFSIAFITAFVYCLKQPDGVAYGVNLSAQVSAAGLTVVTKDQDGTDLEAVLMLNAVTGDVDVYGINNTPLGASTGDIYIDASAEYF